MRAILISVLMLLAIATPSSASEAEDAAAWALGMADILEQNVTITQNFVANPSDFSSMGPQVRDILDQMEDMTVPSCMATAHALFYGASWLVNYSIEEVGLAEAPPLLYATIEMSNQAIEAMTRNECEW